MPDIIKIICETFVDRVEHFDAIDSTNDYLKQLARNETDDPGTVLVVADQQTAGRGRDGRSWVSPQGSLAMSLLLDCKTMGIPSQNYPLLSIAAGIALCRAINSITAAQGLGPVAMIKEPNDIVVPLTALPHISPQPSSGPGDFAKLAGILVEIVGGSLGILGIGLNLNNTTDDLPESLLHERPVATLRDILDSTTDRTTVIVAILNELRRSLELLAADPVALSDELTAIRLP